MAEVQTRWPLAMVGRWVHKGKGQGKPKGQGHFKGKRQRPNLDRLRCYGQRKGEGKRKKRVERQRQRELAPNNNVEGPREREAQKASRAKQEREGSPYCRKRGPEERRSSNQSRCSRGGAQTIDDFQQARKRSPSGGHLRINRKGWEDMQQTALVDPEVWKLRPVRVGAASPRRKENKSTFGKKLVFQMAQRN